MILRNKIFKSLNQKILQIDNKQFNKELITFKNVFFSSKSFYKPKILKISSINRYFFSSQKQKANNDTKKQQQSQEINSQNKQQTQQFTSDEEALIRSYNPDEIFNTFLNLDSKHNFQKELIVAKKRYDRSTKQLRANILFEDLLKTEIKIDIYNTKGRPFNHWWMKNIFNILFFAMTVWFLNSWSNLDEKNKVLLERTTAGKSLKFIMYGFSTWFMVIGFFKYFKFQRRFVDKIVYDTEKENFIITKRKFFGKKYQNQVSRYKIVYTQNEFLNKKGTNYFHLDTKEQYSIPYKQYWIKQDLFSHLIAQRIRV